MDKDELITKLFESMSMTKRVVQNHMSAFVGECQISHSQLELLFTLKRLQPTSPKLLAETMRLTPGAVSQLLEGLVEQGLAEREFNTDDRRVQTISVSKSGMAQLRAITKRRNKIMKSILEDMTTDELQVLLSVQGKFMSKIAKLDKKTKR